MQEVVKLDNFIIKKNIDEINLSKTGKYTLKNKKKFGITSIILSCIVRNKVTTNIITEVSELIFVNVDEKGKPVPHGIT